MAVCKPLYPTSALVPENVVDITQLNDPLSRFNKQDLTTSTALNNILLQNVDLTPYPSLKTIAESSLAPINSTQFADILITSGLSIDFVQTTFINDFPIEIDDTTRNEIINSLVESGYDRQEVISSSNAENLTTLLSVQNSYFDANDFNENLCASFIDPFKKILGVVQTFGDLIDGIQGLAGNITNLLGDIQKYGSLSGIISSLMSTFNSFQDQLISLVDTVKDSLLQKVNGIADTAKRLFNEIGELPKAAFNFINKKIKQVKNFFSAENMNNLKDDIKAFFKKAINQFEDVVPDVLNFFLLKACKLSDLINSIMNKPVDNLSNLVSSYTNTHNFASSFSNNMRSTLSTSGALRVPPQQRKTDRDNGASIWNQANPGQQYLPDDLTTRDQELLDQISETGLSGYFNFNGSNVKIMGQKAQGWFDANKNNETHQKYFKQDENYHYDLGSNGGIVDAGWNKVRLGVWVRLIRAVDATKAAGFDLPELTINSAYRSPYYNWYLREVQRNRGVAVNSRHTKGEALDIKKTGISSATLNEFTRQMRAAGFGGFGSYSSFNHYDVGPLRSW